MDHDGDVLGLNILMSDEANKEIGEFLNSSLSMVDAAGKLVYGLSDSRLCKYNLYSTSYFPLEDKK